MDILITAPKGKLGRRFIEFLMLFFISFSKEGNCDWLYINLLITGFLDNAVKA